jgi:formylmethanofuran dehydrogenase subunit E
MQAIANRAAIQNVSVIAMKTNSTEMQERAQQLWRELDGLDWSSHELAIVGILRDALEEVSDNLVKCARCQEMKETVLVETGFSGEKEPLCGPCVSRERNLTGEMIIKADNKTGSTHMTDRETWGDLMAEQLNG